jgi:hypothetical protein
MKHVISFEDKMEAARTTGNFMELGYYARFKEVKTGGFFSKPHYEVYLDDESYDRYNKEIEDYEKSKSLNDLEKN